MKYKMYCVFAMESVKKMNGVRGKLGAMAGHAFLHSWWNALSMDAPTGLRHNLRVDHRLQAERYKASQHAYKVCLRVDTVDELEVLHDHYRNVCGTSLVTDAGFTVFDEPTTVCLGIGPIAECNVGEDLSSLKTLT